MRLKDTLNIVGKLAMQVVIAVPWESKFRNDLDHEFVTQTCVFSTTLWLGG